MTSPARLPVAAVLAALWALGACAATRPAAEGPVEPSGAPDDDQTVGEPSGAPDDDQTVGESRGAPDDAQTVGESRGPPTSPSAEPPDNAPVSSASASRTSDRQETMAALCGAMAEAITKHAASCSAMGNALTALFDPNLELIRAYQASAVSKSRDRPFAAAEARCRRSLTEPTLKTFWACREDGGVQAAFQQMNSLKP